MKLAYRIATPILAVGTIALALFLPFFSITVGTTDDSELGKTILGLALVAMGASSPIFEFSLFVLLKGGVQTATSGSENDVNQIWDALAPIHGHLIAFLILFVLIILLLIAIAVLSALANNKKKRNIVICLAGGAIILSFAAILVSNAAFAKLGDIGVDAFLSFFIPEKWSDVAQKLLENELISSLASNLLNGLFTIQDATLSAGFFAVFGMLLLLIFWTILTNFILKNPIQRKRSHRRKKPLRSPFASKKAS